MPADTTATQLPFPFTLTGTISDADVNVTSVQCALDLGAFENVTSVAGNWALLAQGLQSRRRPAPLHRAGHRRGRKPSPATGLHDGPSAGRRRARSRHGLDHQLDAARAALPRRRHRPQHQRAPVRSAVADGAAMADGRVPGRRRRHAGAGARARHHRHAVAPPPGRNTGQHAERAVHALRPAAHAAGGHDRAPPHAARRPHRHQHADVCGRSRAAIPAHGGVPGAEQELPQRADRQVRAAAAAGRRRHGSRRGDATLHADHDGTRPGCAAHRRRLAAGRRHRPAGAGCHAGDRHGRPSQGADRRHRLARLVRRVVRRAGEPGRRCVGAVASGICRDRVGKLLRSAAGPDQSRCHRLRWRPPRLEQLRLRLRNQHVQQCRPHFLVRHRDHDSGAGDVPRRAGGAVLGDRGLPPCLRTPARRLRPTSRT